ncbi:hypothetical conserved protein (plasmid) [Rhizobium etli CIAT 652]|uniref:Hypothetical conserved protein n=1 Tax=Rhizobium etli (strain CIAT 652) TaxID=491916 RepID=B3Q243_RHIE6|nr:hypothetical conserved protein [Rhizobium etli CIAT 652]
MRAAAPILSSQHPSRDCRFHESLAGKLRAAALRDRVDAAALGDGVSRLTGRGPAMEKRRQCRVRPVNTFPHAVADPDEDGRLPGDVEIDVDDLVH